VGEYFADIVVEDALLVELKCVDRLGNEHTAQCMNYLKVSRPGEKFLIEPSRKFLLTAARLKDGTNRNEPRGTGQIGLAETSP
jgi:GxxExxY protein